MAVSGTTVVVGEPQRAPGYSGRVYVFTKKTAGWKQSAELKGAVLFELGRMVAVSGKTLVANEGTIGAYVFTRTAAGWKRIAMLKRPATRAMQWRSRVRWPLWAHCRIPPPKGKTVTGHAYVFEA